MKRAHRLAHLGAWFLVTLILLAILMFAWLNIGFQA